VPRDRNREFEPQVIEKRQTRSDDLANRILAMYAKGMSNRDIEDHLRTSTEWRLRPASHLHHQRGGGFSPYAAQIHQDENDYSYTGRPHTYSLESMLAILTLQRIIGVEIDKAFLKVLACSAELRKFCGIHSVPDAAQITRFKQTYREFLKQVFQKLVDLILSKYIQFFTNMQGYDLAPFNLGSKDFMKKKLNN
jgi:hypothetical protein